MKVKLLSKTQNMLDVVYTGARTCYNAGSPIDLFEDIENISDDKKLKLIKSCIESGHDSVLEHTQFTFAIEGVSRSLLAQITRHRISVSFSVQSQRYVNLENTFDYVIPNALQDEDDLQECFTNAMLQCHENYKELINKGIKQEDARAVLPNACCTNMVVTFNLRSLIHLCNLRLCSHAQSEIRQLVKEMVKEVVKVEPWLKPYLQAKCEVLGFCNEKHRPCGRKPTLEELKQQWHDAGYEGGYNEAYKKVKGDK